MPDGSKGQPSHVLVNGTLNSVDYHSFFALIEFGDVGHALLIWAKRHIAEPNFAAKRSRNAVDDRYADLVGAGYPGLQPPYDAFWGARYAIVQDPDGNDVGLMSPSDPERRSQPPAI